MEIEYKIYHAHFLTTIVVIAKTSESFNAPIHSMAMIITVFTLLLQIRYY